MCGFANPWYLLLLLLVPPLLWLWQRRRLPALRHPDVAGLAALPPGRGRLVRRLGLGLRALVLVLLVLALAGPRCPDERTRYETEGLAVVLLLDVSGSMNEKYPPGQAETRLDAAKKAFRLFVEGGEAPDGTVLPGRPTDLIGFIPFARRPQAACPLTLSHGVLLSLLDGEAPRGVPDSETNIADALILGLERLQAAGPRRKVLVLLSDGENTVTQTAYGPPLQVAALAASLKVPVPIYTLNAAGKDAPGRKALEEIAAFTGGRCYNADDGAGLREAVADIDKLERSKVPTFQYRRYHEGYAWFALLGLVVWVGLVGMETTVWQRLP